MAVPIDEGVLSALRGIASKNTRLPKPLLIKVYVSSLKEGEYACRQRVVVVCLFPFCTLFILLICLGLYLMAISLDISQSEQRFK